MIKEEKKRTENILTNIDIAKVDLSGIAYELGKSAKNFTIEDVI